MSTVDLNFTAPDPRWPARYEALAARLGDLPAGVTVQHVGSTAVPGLAAKNCIDILVTAPADALEASRHAIEAAGFEHRPGSFADDPDRTFFRLVEHGCRVAHLHLLVAGHPAAGAMVAVRDLLRRDPAQRRAYQEVKERLAADYPHDRGAYIDGKDAFMQALVVAAVEPRSATSLG